MHFEHPQLPGRRVRLGYCMNLHPAEDVQGVLEGMRRITLPLAERLRSAAGAPFGVGLWLPAAAARELAATIGERGAFARLAAFLREHRLDAFTFNAFPFGGFHREGLKADVFRPTWLEPGRLAFTLDVARVACALRRGAGPSGGHVSISTHAGGLGAWIATEEDRDGVARNLLACAAELARLEAELGVRVVLAIEPEPRSSANDTRELVQLQERLSRLAGDARAAAERHLGVCLDACHAAVEFEEPEEAFARATAAPLGKLQYSSALALAGPGRDPAGRAALLAMAEPVYLHQVTGRPAGGSGGLLRLADLPELDAPPGGPEVAAAWAACDEWRCHFHVPVDRSTFGSAGLATTREAARALLHAALATPDRWGSDELHVEVETYTWDVLGTEGAGDRIDGLERELRAVLVELEGAGWSPIPTPPEAV